MNEAFGNRPGAGENRAVELMIHQTKVIVPPGGFNLGKRSLCRPKDADPADRILFPVALEPGRILHGKEYRIHVAFRAPSRIKAFCRDVTI